MAATNTEKTQKIQTTHSGAGRDDDVGESDDDNDDDDDDDGGDCTCFFSPRERSGDLRAVHEARFFRNPRSYSACLLPKQRRARYALRHQTIPGDLRELPENGKKQSKLR